MSCSSSRPFHQVVAAILPYLIAKWCLSRPPFMSYFPIKYLKGPKWPTAAHFAGWYGPIEGIGLRQALRATFVQVFSKPLFEVGSCP